MLYDFGSSILRSIGDSEHPLYSLIAAVCKRVHEFWVLMIIYPISWVVTGIAMMIRIRCCGERFWQKVV